MAGYVARQRQADGNGAAICTHRQQDWRLVVALRIYTTVFSKSPYRPATRQGGISERGEARTRGAAALLFRTPLRTPGDSVGRRAGRRA